MNGTTQPIRVRYVGQHNKAVIGIATGVTIKLTPGMEPFDGQVNEYSNVYMDGQYVGELGRDFEEVVDDHLPDQV